MNGIILFLILLTADLHFTGSHFEWLNIKVHQLTWQVAILKG